MLRILSASKHYIFFMDIKMLRNFNMINISVASSMIYLATISASAATTLPPFTLNGGVSTIPNFGSVATATNTPLVVTGTNITTQASQVISGHASGLASVTDYSAPAVSAAVVTDGTYAVVADPELTYYFQLIAPVGHASGVNVLADGNYLVSQDMFPSNFGEVGLLISACYFGSCSPTPIVSMFVGPGQSTDGTGLLTAYHESLLVDPSAIYKVDLFALAANYGTPGVMVNAMIDPVFSVDPSTSEAQNYQFAFSAGVLNTSVTAVPLPGSAPLFGTAFLALAGFRYSMNRRVASKGKKAAMAA